jgi:hypothetical protein
MNVSNAKITKILSKYHLKLDREGSGSDDTVAVKCDRGWVISDDHRACIKCEWFDDPGYLAGYLMSNVKPCHCPACMRSDDWVHELSYLRTHIEDVCSKLGIVSYKWNERDHSVAGFFWSEVYEDDKPVFIQWKPANATHGFVQAVVAMNNWDNERGCQREPIKRRVVDAPSTNSLYVALMGIRGDMYTPIKYKAEQMDTEGVESLAAECAQAFARSYVYRNPADHSYRACNKRDEQRIRNNEIWWASMYEPDDVIRQLKAEQAEYIKEYSRICGADGGAFV